MRGSGGRLALAVSAMTMAAGVVGAGPAGASNVIYATTGGGFPNPFHELFVLPVVPSGLMVSEPMLATVRVAQDGRSATVQDDLILFGGSQVVVPPSGCAWATLLRSVRCVAPADSTQPIGLDLWGGPLADRLTASGPHVQSVFGGGGDDRIDVRGVSSISAAGVSCGAGRDTVLAGQTTPVGTDCEIVQRS